MQSRLEERLRSSSWRLGLALCLTLLAAGCESLPPADLGLSKYLKSDQPEVSGAKPVAIGEWQRDHLHCAAERCDNFYWIDVARSGELRVEVYAPWGSDLPDFGVVLLDPMGKPLAAPKEPSARPARLASRVSPGRYTVRVHAMGSNDGRIGYELIANFTAGKGSSRSQSSTRKSKTSKTSKQQATDSTPKQAAPQKSAAKPPVSQPPRGAPLVRAEVLDVEQEEGQPIFVLLDAGEPERIEVGMRGRLQDSGTILGEIEIVEVYRDGSRARLLGELSGEITIDTAAEIFDAR
jgi:hypothetical protein